MVQRAIAMTVWAFGSHLWWLEANTWFCFPQKQDESKITMLYPSTTDSIIELE